MRTVSDYPGFDYTNIIAYCSVFTGSGCGYARLDGILVPSVIGRSSDCVPSNLLLH